MIRIVVLMMFATISCLLDSAAIAAPGANGINGNNRLIMIQGDILNVYFNGEIREIKRAETFYGYGWLDDHRVFMAYQPKGWAEASARMDVYDAEKSRTYSLGEVGDTGDSNFDVNSDTHEIVYNDTDGIELMTVDLNNLPNFKLSRRTRLIKKGADVGWGAFWIDRSTVGYWDPATMQVGKVGIAR